MIWQDINRQVIQHYSHGVSCTRVQMHPTFLEKFIREQRQLRSFHPTDKAGVPVLGMVPKSITFRMPDGVDLTLVVRVSKSSPMESFVLDSTPLTMNPISGRYE